MDDNTKQNVQENGRQSSSTDNIWKAIKSVCVTSMIERLMKDKKFQGTHINM